MNKVLLSTSTAFLIAAGSASSFANCEIIDADLDKKISENQQLRAEYNASLLRDARSLRDAAGTLTAYGKEDACAAVSEAIREMVENPKAAAAAKAGVTGEEVVVATKSADDRRASAVSVSKMTSRIRAEEIIGTDVFGAKGDTVGEVADIVFGANGQPTYAVVSYGGFLGVAEDQAAIPFKLLKVSSDKEAFFVDMTEEELEKAPRFETGRYDWIEDEAWRTKNEQYFAPKN
ncbi:PRC-barrel domain-containing protein [Denitrobaculum tricleocarpae]|uniref:PRC-barrel domain containing protein n=1 Tax=Denitrobaculum tricleocarpae TaxID=2591009 RepID=A0A545SYQ8_9PROT|nr:PRC-barrel domain-containing protein [Denitrobaculum tricleocarpae]TQV70100.1 PRC-barrel domain containing protein [Denitrobaculum tricleocarpae]